MKKIKFIVTAIVAVLVSLGSTSVFAQEDGNRDANGYVVKGPYLTNGFGSNVFVGVGGGFNTTLAKGITPLSEFNVANNWAAEVFVGKWFTPTIGVRVGYKGVMNNFGFDTEKYVSSNYANGEQFRFGYAHADLMWNLSDALSGYKESRFWDIIPYAGAGYLGINNGQTDSKLAVGAGIYNEFRLGKAVNLFVDLGVIATESPTRMYYAADMRPVLTPETNLLVKPLYMPTATVGLTVNLSKKKNFDRYTSVAPLAELDKLSKDLIECGNRNGELQKENALLREQLVKEQNKPAEKVIVKEEVRVLVGSNIITFPIGSCVLSETEKAKVEAFAKSLDKDTLVQVLGSADSKTGTETRNFALAKNRANVVKNELVKNGVAEDRIAVDGKIDATDNVNTSRSAILTLSVE